MEAFEQSFMGFEPVEKSAPPIESFMYTNWVTLKIQNTVVNAPLNAKKKPKKLTDSHFQQNLYIPQIKMDNYITWIYYYCTHQSVH